jgi:hypothetical protein
LEGANLTLELRRYRVRLAKDSKCCIVESYASATKAIDEIGKLVGGWLHSLSIFLGLVESGRQKGVAA